MDDSSYIYNYTCMYKLSMQERKIDTQYEYYNCSRVPNLRTVTTAIIYGTIAILQICALFMAVKTRKVQIKGLNDAKHIAAIVYLASLVSLIQLIATFTLRNRVNTYPVVVATSVVLVTMIMQGLVFIPKVYILRSKMLIWHNYEIHWLV